MNPQVQRLWRKLIRARADGNEHFQMDVLFLLVLKISTLRWAELAALVLDDLDQVKNLGIVRISS